MKDVFCATCNIPVHTYMQLTGDSELNIIKISKVKKIYVFGERTRPVFGEIILEVTRKSIICLIRGLILKGTQFHAILVKKSMS